MVIILKIYITESCNQIFYFFIFIFKSLFIFCLLMLYANKNDEFLLQNSV